MNGGSQHIFFYALYNVRCLILQATASKNASVRSAFGQCSALAAMWVSNYNNDLREILKLQKT